MPRCNLTLKQKIQIIDLSSNLSTEQIAKKFRVHPTTITRTLQKKKKFQEQASRVNNGFKTVQTFLRNEEHDVLVLDYIRSKQNSNEPLTIKEICDKAEEFAIDLNRNLKSKRGWWRRFKVRCNIVRSKIPKNTIQSIQNPSPQQEQIQQQPQNKKESTELDVRKSENVKRKTKRKSTSKQTKKDYTFKVKETGQVTGNTAIKGHSNLQNTLSSGVQSSTLEVENIEIPPPTDTTPCDL